MHVCAREEQTTTTVSPTFTHDLQYSRLSSRLGKFTNERKLPQCYAGHLRTLCIAKPPPPQLLRFRLATTCSTWVLTRRIILNFPTKQDSAKHWQVLFDRLRAAHPSSGGPPGGGGSLALALGGWSCLAGGTVLGKLSIFTGQVRNVVEHPREKRDGLWSCCY